MDLHLLNQVVLALHDDVVLDVRNLYVTIPSNYEDDGTEQPDRN